MSTRTVTSQRIEDALFLLKWGEHPSTFPTRLGTNLEALCALFRRRQIPIPVELEAELRIERATKNANRKAAA